MRHIQVLDQITIDKIAAGEVIERPASVVKELVENSIDAQASSVTVEIEDGGISLIRITDNGTGIAGEDIRNAFLRHSTSKIQCVEDLLHVSSLGFRGEALSSIAAVTKVELVTKTASDEAAFRYVIEGGREIVFEETGASYGTIFTVRQLFYNVPARRKFLKTAMTEAGHVQDLLIRLSLSHPEKAFCFISNGQEKLKTSGSGKLKEVIYHIYGREIAANLLEIDFSQNDVHITGFIGKPAVVRGNRNFETFFVNGRYIKSSVISRAAEDAYKDFMMQHKFPFVILNIEVEQDTIDVNVHPTKMELRFQKQQDVYNAVFEGIHRRLLEPELILKATVPEPESKEVREEPLPGKSPFLLQPENEDSQEKYFLQKMRERVEAFHNRSSSAEVSDKSGIFREDRQNPRISAAVRETGTYMQKQEEQMNLFTENFLKRESLDGYQLIGQIFETYWLVQFQENLYIIDQHAAHERILYEKMIRELKSQEITSQYVSPPLLLHLSMQEADLLKENLEHFSRIGFEIEPFGGDTYAVSQIPGNLLGIAKEELLLEMIDSLTEGLSPSMTPESIDEKIASMSCKAAVKGNSRLSAKEADTLIQELLRLENPYHCPHGRPTIISISKRELEKKFKRIV